jgi:hypothetical protein
VGEGFETNNKLKKIFLEKRGGWTTLVRWRIFEIFLLKFNFKCELGKVGGSQNSIKENGDEEERDRLLA